MGMVTRAASLRWFDPCLEGKPTATTEGEKFKAEYQPLLADLGAYPHAKLNAGTNRKVQGTRMLKAACPVAGIQFACLPSGPQSVCLNAQWMALNWLFPNRLNISEAQTHERTTNSLKTVPAPRR
jgi:hypothetical protein